MRPKAQRSRACNQCRERRVKCDETPETCQQCRRLGLKCSGPIQGSVIIDMTDKVTKPRQRKKRETKSADVVRHETLKERLLEPSELQVRKTELLKMTVYLPLIRSSKPITPPMVDASGDVQVASLSDIRRQYRLPMLYQPSQADAFDNAFVSHFVRMNTAVQLRNRPEARVILHLPGLHYRATKPALRLSIRAATMAFYAQIHRDPSVLVDSYRWYTMSLNTQRLALSKFTKQSIPDDEEVLVPIILGLYEVYAGTTPASVFQHLSAAARILDLRGPRNCGSGVSFGLFKMMRISDAHKAIIFNEPSILSSQEWLTIPFIFEPKNPWHQLADIFLAIPACVRLCGLRGNLGKVFSQPIPLGTDLRPVQKRCAELLRDLSDWLAHYPHLYDENCVPVMVTLDLSRVPTEEELVTHKVPAITLPDSFLAFVAASFDSVRLILTLLQNKVTSCSREVLTSTPDPNTPPLTPISTGVSEAVTYSKTILKITEYMESSHPVGIDFLRTTFPLVVVAMLGPRGSEQNKAREMLGRWGKKGVGGLCESWT